MLRTDLNVAPVAFTECLLDRMVNSGYVEIQNLHAKLDTGISIAVGSGQADTFLNGHIIAGKAAPGQDAICGTVEKANWIFERADLGDPTRSGARRHNVDGFGETVGVASVVGDKHTEPTVAIGRRSDSTALIRARKYLLETV